MAKRFYLGLNAGGPKISEMLFTHGNSQNVRELNEYLARKYQGAPILCKNGRSALAIALKAYFDPGDKIIVNGFTCYAVYEAIKAAEMVPVFMDIDPKNLNFSTEILENFWKKMRKERVSTTKIKGIIIQNTLGNPGWAENQKIYRTRIKKAWGVSSSDYRSKEGPHLYRKSYHWWRNLNF